MEELARALAALGDDPGVEQRPEVVAGGRLRHGQRDLSAGELPVGGAAGQLAHDLEANRVGERLEDLHPVELLRLFDLHLI